MIKKWVAKWFGFDKEIQKLLIEIHELQLDHPRFFNPARYLGQMKWINIKDNKGTPKVRKKLKNKKRKK